MTKLERVLTAFARRTPDKTPKWIQNGAHLARLVKENTGSDGPAKYFDMDIQRHVRYGATENPGDFSEYPSYDSTDSVNEWGIRGLQGNLTPMRDFQTVDDVYEYAKHYGFWDVGRRAKYSQRKNNDSGEGRRTLHRPLPYIEAANTVGEHRRFLRGS